MINFKGLLPALSELGVGDWADALPNQVECRLKARKHGNLERWRATIATLPTPLITSLNLGCDAITVESDICGEMRGQVERALLDLQPWRKGPFSLHGVYVDSEWRSHWKWQRVVPHVSSLADRAVLDVGCGNGYYLWRMLGAGAKLALGIDPTQLYLMQFTAVRHLLGTDLPAYLLPLGVEDLPTRPAAFDTVFSMGVLYHRRSPIDHLLTLRELLRPGGELVLETLVVDGGAGNVLVPTGRYAKMRNVWFLPSVTELENWLRRVGFCAIRAVDFSVTTIDEQRSTRWMRFESLSDFLDPVDNSRTIEGYAGPIRATILANAPS